MGSTSRLLRVFWLQNYLFKMSGLRWVTRPARGLWSAAPWPPGAILSSVKRVSLLSWPHIQSYLESAHLSECAKVQWWLPSAAIQLQKFFPCSSLRLEFIISQEASCSTHTRFTHFRVGQFSRSPSFTEPIILSIRDILSPSQFHNHRDILSLDW